MAFKMLTVVLITLQDVTYSKKQSTDEIASNILM